MYFGVYLHGHCCMRYFSGWYLRGKLPTIVSAHTFCASRKAWFTARARARVEIDAINYAIKYVTKMKAKFPYCDQIKFNEPVLKPGTLEEQRIANH